MGLTLRQRVALNFPPLLLRLMLATIFLWAGLGKVFSHIEVEGTQAATLANLGIITTTEPADELLTDAHFAQPVQVLRVHGLTLNIYHAANPPTTEDGQAMRLWPERLGEGRLPVYFAWTVALTEIMGAVGLIIGLFTRIWALALAGIMLGAIWLTEIGVAIQSGQASLGFLPAYETFNPAAWQRLLWQFSVLMSALALALLGPGRASLDHAIFGSPGDDDDEE